MTSADAVAPDCRCDEDLLRAMSDGDEHALAALYARYGGLAYTLALRIVGDGGAAEEIVQEAFLGAWRGAATYRPERGSIKAWLLGIARNRAIDVVRARSVRVRTVTLIPEMPLQSADDPAGEVERQLQRASVRAAVASLPSEQRESLELAYFGGLSFPEIASRLMLPVGTVKSRVRLALRKLAPILGHLSAGEADPPAASADLP